jgi:hypothetical protein
MSNRLPDAYWDSLGDHGPFLRALLSDQAQQLEQLRLQNQELQGHFINTQNNLANVASTAAVAAAQQIATPAPPTIPSSHRPIKAADPEKFSGDRAETEGFIRAIKLAIAVQPGSFPDERTKILYALSFMTSGSAQIWAHNETEAVINGSSTIQTFEAFARRVQEAFGDPDLARTARTKLHNLKMTSGMSADEYTAQFEILAGRTGFNDAALEDAFTRGLPATILDKIHAQPSLPTNLKAWKESACQIDRNYRRLTEVKRAQGSHAPARSSTGRTNSTPATTALTTAASTDTSVPMDIDSSHRRVEKRTCYRCGTPGHIAPNCTQPPKQRVRTNLTEADIAGMISQSVAAAMDAHKSSQSQAPDEKQEKGF